MKISAADSGVEDTDFDIVDADFGLGHLSKPKTAFRAGFYKCFHVATFPGCPPFGLAPDVVETSGCSHDAGIVILPFGKV